MEEIFLYNTLTRKKSLFKPIKKGKAGIYSCGPTVYNFAHIGNLRTYIFNDIFKRTLLYNNFKVAHIMNITDVDDKTIKKSREESIPLHQLTQKYTSSFLSDLNDLNIILPTKLTRATNHINEMIQLIQILIKKKYAYKTSDGVYFSIAKFKNYGKLSQLHKIKKTKERIAKDSYDKSSVNDFALWKFHTHEDGNIFWEAPFGKGRPGWHIECSAMSMKYLTEHFDIHTGASDLIFPHHTNEIAQSESATGKKFVNYWLHAGFLTLQENKMSKSIGNLITLNNLKKENYHPLHFRYLSLLTHYRKPLSFSFENLDAARNSFQRLKRKISMLKNSKHKGKDLTQKYEHRFQQAINDDLNMPKAIQICWKALDDFDFSPKKKLLFLKNCDKVLGLEIMNTKEEYLEIPPEIQQLIKERENLRKRKKWAESDILRERIKEKGYLLEDTPTGINIKKSES